MSTRLRLALFGVGGAGLAVLLAWGLGALPAFGHYPGPYGDLIVQLAKPQRHIANAVTAVVFDYRGVDTMGEELILFAAASGTAMLLREVRQAETREIVDAVRSDGLRAVGAVAAVAWLVLALNVVAHGTLTPGGGFQGGVLLAFAFALVFLAVEYRAFNRLASPGFAGATESVGAGGYVGLGLVAVGLGSAFLENFLPLGTYGRLTSAGSVALVNWASALAVCGGFLVIFGEYLEEAMAARYARLSPDRGG